MSKVSEQLTIRTRETRRLTREMMLGEREDHWTKEQKTQLTIAFINMVYRCMGVKAFDQGRSPGAGAEAGLLGEILVDLAKEVLDIDIKEELRKEIQGVVDVLKERTKNN